MFVCGISSRVFGLWGCCDLLLGYFFHYVCVMRMFNPCTVAATTNRSYPPPRVISFAEVPLSLFSEVGPVLRELNELAILYMYTQ